MTKITDNQAGQKPEVSPSVQSTQNISANGSIFGSLASVLVGIVLGLCVVCIVILTLNYFNILQLSRISPQLAVLPRVLNTIVIPKSKIETCNITSREFSLVYDVTDTNTVITGQYRGTIAGINRNGLHGNVSINMISKDGTESHMFSIDKNTPVYDAVHALKITLTDLHTGQYIGMDFNCDKTNGGQFRIVNIGIQQNLE